jgi:hypothetical protein
MAASKVCTPWMALQRTGLQPELMAPPPRARVAGVGRAQRCG